MSLPPTRRAALLTGSVAVALLTGCTAPPPARRTATPRPVRTGYAGRPIGPPAEPGDAPVPAAPPVGEVVALPVGGRPWGVAAAHELGEVYVALREPARLAVLDMRTRAVRVVAVPGTARMIDLATPTGPLLLPAEDRNRLYELALPSLTVASSVATRRQPHQAVQVGDTVFLSEEYGHAVRAVRAGRTVAHFPEPVQPGGITAVGDRVAVVDVATNALFVYDATALRLVASLPAGEGPSHVVPIGGTRVAVCDVRGNAVLTYDIGGVPKALGRVAVPGRAFWIVADPETGLVHTALADTNLVARVRVAADGTSRLVSTIPTVQQPISMDLDMRTGVLYVAGNARSQLQIVPPEAFS